MISPGTMVFGSSAGEIVNGKIEYMSTLMWPEINSDHVGYIALRGDAVILTRDEVALVVSVISLPAYPQSVVMVLVHQRLFYGFIRDFHEVTT